VNEAVNRYLEAASGLTNLTASKAESIVKQLVRSGEAASDQVSELVDDLMERRRKNRDAIAALVKSETTRAVRAMGLATGREVERLQKQVADLKREVRSAAAGTGLPGTARRTTAKKATRASSDSPAASPDEASAAPAKKATGKKATAKKSTAKKSTAKEVDREEVDRQEVDRQEGHRQEGHRQEGHRQEGHRQEGHRQEGHRQEGHRRERPARDRVTADLGASCGAGGHRS
jgi:polyhydroxyalkanoate synthesis regulator phasin